MKWPSQERIRQIHRLLREEYVLPADFVCPVVRERRSQSTTLAPVDAHHFRVAARLGFVPDGILGALHLGLRSLLPSDWKMQEVHDHHAVMSAHGRRCCWNESPACHRCVISPLCPWASEMKREFAELMS